MVVSGCLGGCVGGGIWARCVAVCVPPIDVVMLLSLLCFVLFFNGL
jgi:hypothetical protein